MFQKSVELTNKLTKKSNWNCDNFHIEGERRPPTFEDKLKCVWDAAAVLSPANLAITPMETYVFVLPKEI